MMTLEPLEILNRSYLDLSLALLFFKVNKNLDIFNATEVQ